MLVAFQAIGVAATPLNVAMPEPCGDAKLLPVIVTEVPTAAGLGEKLVIARVGSTC
jgi:hypothetical protein